MLTPRQRAAVDCALRSLHRSNVAIVGSGGTGKSLTLRSLALALVARGRRVLIVSSMAIAAAAHADLPGVSATTIAAVLASSRAHRGLDGVLIVEEAWTAGCAAINALLSHVTDDGRVTVPVVVVGDCRQLPPVNDAPHAASRLWWQCQGTGRRPHAGARGMRVLSLSSVMRFSAGDWRARAAAALQRGHLAAADRILGASGRFGTAPRGFVVVATNAAVTRRCLAEMRSSALDGLRTFSSGSLHIVGGAELIVTRAGGIVAGEARLLNGSRLVAVSWTKWARALAVVAPTDDTAFVVARDAHGDEHTIRPAADGSWGMTAAAACTVHRMQGQTVASASVDATDFNIFEDPARMMLVAITRGVRTPLLFNYEPGLVLRSRHDAARTAASCFEEQACLLTRRGTMQLHPPAWPPPTAA